MGASLLKLSSGNKENEKMELIKKCYDMYFHDRNIKDADKFHHFYHAVCETVEAINRKSGNTQIRIPNTDELERQYYYYVRKPGDKLTTENFQKILQSLVANAGFTNAGAMDTFLYILSAPATALVIKNAVKPNAISNQVLIPGVTSAAVLILAALKKI